MGSSGQISSDTTSEHLSPVKINIGLSPRPMLIRATTGINGLFPFSAIINSIGKQPYRFFLRKSGNKKTEHSLKIN